MPKHELPDDFATRYPNIADWVMDGWIEIGNDGGSKSFIRALDTGGLVWEGKAAYSTLDAALDALEVGIGAWYAKTGIMDGDGDER